MLRDLGVGERMLILDAVTGGLEQLTLGLTRVRLVTGGLGELVTGGLRDR